MKYKLSICMMVKNEELHLKRCLDSIEEVIKRDDVELIIVDTGSIDYTVAIAKQYTNKVYFKEWFDDFSGMRNLTISYAKGEWIFILDADEVIENINELKLFLDKEILNNVNTYFIKAKNYNSLINLEAYSLIVTPRIFRNDGTIHYEGTVHNQAIYKEPFDYLNIFIGHYGYIVSDIDIMNEKFNRTTKLLLKELEDKPKDLYYLYQLATSYNMHGDIEESYEISKKAYDILCTSSVKEQSKGLVIFSVHLSNSLVLGNYDEVIEVSKRAIKLRPDYIDGYFFLIYAHEKVGHIEVAKKYAEIYLDLVTKFDQLSISKDDSIAIYRNNIMTINKIKLFMAKYFFNKKNYEKVIDYIDIDYISKSNLNILIIAYIKLKKYMELENLYKYLTDEDLKLEMIDYLETAVATLDLENKVLVRQRFENIKDTYSMYCKFCLLPERELNKRIDYAEKIYKSMDSNKIRVYYSDILSFLCQFTELDLKLFNKFSKSSIFEFINHFYSNNYNTVYKKILFFLENIDINQSILKNSFTLKYIFEAVIIKIAQEYKNTGINIAIKNNMHIFKKYLRLGLNLIEKIYLLDGMSLKYEYIYDRESKFVILMYLHEKNKNVGNIKAGLKYLKLSAETYPEMSDFIAEYIKSEYI